MPPPSPRVRALDAHFTSTVVFRSAILAAVMVAPDDAPIVLDLADFDVPAPAALHQAAMALEVAQLHNLDRRVASRYGADQIILWRA